jgi:hypothetical protein
VNTHTLVQFTFHQSKNRTLCVLGNAIGESPWGGPLHSHGSSQPMDVCAYLFAQGLLSFPSTCFIRSIDALLSRMSGRIVVTAFLASDPATKKRVALLETDDWEGVLSKLRGKFGLELGAALQVFSAGAEVEAPEEVAPNDTLELRVGISPVERGPVASARTAVASFFETNKLHTRALFNALQMLQRLMRNTSKSDPKYRKVTMSLPALAAVFGPPVRAVGALLLGLGFQGSGDVFELPAGRSIPPDTLEALHDLQQYLLPMLPSVSLTHSGSEVMQLIGSGRVRPAAARAEAGGAMVDDATRRGGGDAMERLEAVAERLRAVSAKGYAEARARGFAPPDGVDREWEEREWRAPLGESASSSSVVESPSSSGAAVAKEDLRTAMNMFHHLSQPSTGGGRLTDSATRAESRVEAAEDGGLCRLRFDLPGRQLFGTFRLDEPGQALLQALSEFMSVSGVTLRLGSTGVVDPAMSLAELGVVGKAVVMIE